MGTGRALQLVKPSSQQYLVLRQYLGGIGGRPPPRQRGLALGFPASDERRPSRSRGLGRWRGYRHLLPGLPLAQGPGIGPNVHVALHGDEHVHAPLLLAPTEVFAVNETPVHNQQLHHPFAYGLNELLHHGTEHRVFVDLARPDPEPRINVMLPAQVQ